MRINDTAAIALTANRKLHDRIKFQGMDVSIENRQGSVRKGVGKDGKPWSVKMTHPYGYLRMTEGVDGDAVDCFIGPNESAKNVYVIHTTEPTTGKFDEDKCMLGFNSKEDAKSAFLENYSNPKFFGSIDEIPVEEFKKKALATKRNPVKIVAVAGGLGSLYSLLRNAERLQAMSPGGT